MWETTEERTKGASRQHLNMCLQFCVFKPMHSCVWNRWETQSCAWSKCRAIRRPKVCFHPSISLGKLHRTWFSKLGIVSSLQKSACNTIPCSWLTKLHVPLTQLAPDLCSKHYSRCRDGEGKLALPAPLHGPMCSSAKSRRLGQNTRDYITLLLHIHTAHVKAERRAHKRVEQWQIALGYVSTLRREKKPFLPGGNTALSTYFISSPAATPPLPSCLPRDRSFWGSRIWGTACPAQGSWAYTNVSTFVQLLHHKTSAFIILSYQLTQSKLAWNFWYRLPCCWLSKSCMPTEGLFSWDIQFSKGFAAS